MLIGKIAVKKVSLHYITNQIKKDVLNRECQEFLNFFLIFILKVSGGVA